MKTRWQMMTVLLWATVALGGPPPLRFGGDSLYQLGSTWQDAAGTRARLDRLAGHPVLLAMIYTSCQASCPLTISEMQAIEKKLSPAARAQVRFVLVSFDPARDTPARLSEVAAEHHLPAPGWVLLTGKADGVRELAAVLGFRYQPLEGGEFTHSNLLTVLGPDGVIRAQLSGTGQDPAELLKALEAEASRPKK